MVNVVLLAARTQVDNIAIPHWEKLYTGTTPGMAATVFKRACSNGKASWVLWCEIDSNGSVAIRGYADFTGNGDLWAGYHVPTEIHHAENLVEECYVEHMRSYEGCRYATTDR